MVLAVPDEAALTDLVNIACARDEDCNVIYEDDGQVMAIGFAPAPKSNFRFLGRYPLLR